jgi:uncharacterized protein YcgL (UPF0745 family)
MKIDIYKSATSELKYLSILAGDDVSRVSVQDPDYAKLIRKSSGIELQEHENAEIVSDIRQQGYHLHVVRYPIN